ncbi:lysophospholipase L2 [Vibrio nigripulchritudo]|uniref:alpha/beta fold hydrolase n=1 Tax=Vibrio nigripulchritudo TaxID=28173 RepID=UPI00190E48D0|nr:alpha/beta fold hydrolase [Vibrio nigripulchritudo]BCL71560.1 lysophospholipase L2 [Vibrio nigripulchritudo]BDU32917.1 lysophospholipase L2 [Vibrio nigripulchritudo]BDU38960.1 lysophospholipase L2 [Vibrio nigripulchritudo]BDU44680.1 lysophospholipase L2 [Vibrio nigripulchritudo]
MSETASSHYPFSQEDTFSQNYELQIAPFWQQRQHGYAKGKNQRQLYWVSFTSPEHTKAIVVVNGRIESTWKYQELFFDLFQQGYDVYSYDHQGQGLSDRLLDNPELGHVVEFQDYVEDLDLMVSQFHVERYDESFLLGHSMGGAIIARYLQTHPSAPFQAAALSAPMFGLNLSWYMKPIAKTLSRIISSFSKAPDFAPGQGPYWIKPFENNPLTFSKTRYTWFRELYETMPQLKLGGPSSHWVWQSLIAAQQCVKHAADIKTPLLLLQAGDDIIVSNEAQSAFINNLKHANLPNDKLVLPDSRHELLFERDHIRNVALSKILGFFQSKQST